MMKKFAACLSLFVAAATLSAQTWHASWLPGEAFIDAGLLESYLPMDGVSWSLNARIDLNFEQGSSDRRPQSIFSPKPCAWLCFGNELHLRCDSVYEIRQVVVTTLADYPLLSGHARASVGELICLENRATWMCDHPVNELTISQPGPYADIFVTGGRVAITEVAVTYGPYSAAINEISATPSEAEIYDLQGRRVTSVTRRGLYIVGGRLKKL